MAERWAVDVDARDLGTPVRDRVGADRGHDDRFAGLETSGHQAGRVTEVAVLLDERAAHDVQRAGRTAVVVEVET